MTCNFEQAYLCGYEFFQMASHGTPYAWHRWKGLTLTHQTGPEEDHTLGTTEGKNQRIQSTVNSDIFVRILFS